MTTGPDHHDEMEAHYAAGIARQDRVLESAVVALVAEFVGDITGLRPPVERALFPPHMKPALDRLCNGLMQVAKEIRSERAAAENERLKRVIAELQTPEICP